MLLTSKGKTTGTQELIQAGINALVTALESGHSEVLTSYLKAMARFHTYSFGNICLIAAQKPSATQVAGIRTWNELDRRVKRGEKGILIFAPRIGFKRVLADPPAEAQGKKAKKNGKADAAQPQQPKVQTEPQLLGFRAVYVFDVAQTEGEPLPTVTGTVTGEVGDKLEKLMTFVQSQEIKLEFSEAIAPARGVSYGGLIRLLPDMEPANTLSVLVHEISHEMLHKAERRTLVTKTVRETEAEAVAFVVCDALGLENGTGSADYIQLYHGNASLLAESLEVIQQTSGVILAALEPPVANEATTDAELAEVA